MSEGGKKVKGGLEGAFLVRGRPGKWIRLDGEVGTDHSKAGQVVMPSPCPKQPYMGSLNLTSQNHKQAA